MNAHSTHQTSLPVITEPLTPKSHHTFWLARQQQVDTSIFTRCKILSTNRLLDKSTLPFANCLTLKMVVGRALKSSLSLAVHVFKKTYGSDCSS
ncbi:hypothetical protein HYPBUDRAFT_152536 [Hyphopichia burtonii NRRL Y-1933]|uniref:Uncharacterized protein n=1 Tax=Hyphopichia burtonii NRRL Y-1933 TaxID=984485 RepID=A0A1E4RKV7_9ASCO|nr:hypothetical protein HYPBUDRAFT_152536 [Hyphopichia burtonii NRRL Y-1933]ODV67715.1 hypothetical protein HYPBUDRAFT_152536 [Hyphopichia burtonii NRRL Y-1933]